MQLRLMAYSRLGLLELPSRHTSYPPMTSGPTGRCVLLCGNKLNDVPSFEDDLSLDILAAHGGSSSSEYPGCRYILLHTRRYGEDW